jgi:hypothetical protein
MVDIEELARRALDILRAREETTVGELARMLGVEHLEGRLALEVLEERRVGYFATYLAEAADVEIFSLYEQFREA